MTSWVSIPWQILGPLPRRGLGSVRPRDWNLEVRDPSSPYLGTTHIYRANTRQRRWPRGNPCPLGPEECPVRSTEVLQKPLSFRTPTRPKDPAPSRGVSLSRALRGRVRYSPRPVVPVSSSLVPLGVSACLLNTPGPLPHCPYPSLSVVFPHPKSPAIFTTF